MSSEAEDTGFDEEESPTRQSGVVVRAYAREVEALIARGGDARDAQGLVETIPPRSLLSLGDGDAAAPLDAIVHLLVSSDELAWFQLGCEGTAIVNAADGDSTLSVVLARTGLPVSEGLVHVDMLIEMGLLALR